MERRGKTIRNVTGKRFPQRIRVKLDWTGSKRSGLKSGIGGETCVIQEKWEFPQKKVGVKPWVGTK